MISADLIPLHSAAATAYRALVGQPAKDRPQPADGVLDVVAIALSACIPIYAARSAEQPLARLADADLARGTFVQGATRLRLHDGSAPFVRLAVTQADFAEGIARLKRAGVNFSEARFEPAPRRVPGVAPR
jgi:hypothetical protein